MTDSQSAERHRNKYYYTLLSLSQLNEKTDVKTKKQLSIRRKYQYIHIERKGGNAFGTQGKHKANCSRIIINH